MKEETKLLKGKKKKKVGRKFCSTYKKNRDTIYNSWYYTSSLIQKPLKSPISFVCFTNRDKPSTVMVKRKGHNGSPT